MAVQKKDHSERTHTRAHTPRNSNSELWRKYRISSSLQLLVLSLGLAAAAIELTPDNFDKEVFESGKAAFVKFLAPW